MEQAKSDINEEKQETRHFRESFEHYQARAAEDRQLEREQYPISKRQLEERIQATSQQLNLELNRSEQLVTEKQQLSDEVKQLSSDPGQTKENFQVQKLKANDKASILEDEYKIILQEKAMLQGQFKQLQASM